MPRLSIRRLFIYCLGIASCLLLVLNIHQRTVQLFLAPFTGPGPHNVPPTGNAIDTGQRAGPSGPNGAGASNEAAGAEYEEGSAQNKQKSSAESIQNSKRETIKIASHMTMNTSNRHPKAMDLSDLDPNDVHIPEPEQRAWYMKGGSLKPSASENSDADNNNNKVAQVFPEDLPGHDRIPEQLMYYPPDVPENQEQASVPLKKILLWNGISSWGGLRPGRGVFLKEKCPVNSCVLSSSRQDATTADLVLFKDHFTSPTFSRPPEQLWMMYLLECPLHTQMFKQKNVFNWTATYRSDSTIVAPYERWQYYNENVRTKEQNRNFAANKTKAVAWFVSNCGARNGRLNFAKELMKYIEVDIYGSCGTKRCPRSQAGECFKMLDRDYKFYLAFENSNCKDYITEKFYVNGLGAPPLIKPSYQEDIPNIFSFFQSYFP